MAAILFLLFLLALLYEKQYSHDCQNTPKMQQQYSERKNL